ncbi:MAG: TadE family protein [Acidimicrobiia bacterium]|jgi:Flp pilus assembly protein TadG
MHRFLGDARERTRAHGPGGRSSERGAALVEFVLILPIFIMIVFGTIEFSSAYNDSAVVADAARAGGRIGSTAPGTDYTSANATNLVTSNVQTAVKALPAGSPKELWVYEANDKGYPGATGVTGWGSCPTGTCVKYTWNSTTNEWDYASGSYLAANQNACGTTPDELGIRVVADHAFVTRLFGTTFTLDDKTVFRFEPSATC